MKSLSNAIGAAAVSTVNNVSEFVGASGSLIRQALNKGVPAVIAAGVMQIALMGGAQAQQFNEYYDQQGYQQQGASPVAKGIACAIGGLAAKNIEKGSNDSSTEVAVKTLAGCGVGAVIADQVAKNQQPGYGNNGYMTEAEQRRMEREQRRMQREQERMQREQERYGYGNQGYGRPVYRNQGEYRNQGYRHQSGGYNQPNYGGVQQVGYPTAPVAGVVQTGYIDYFAAQISGNTQGARAPNVRERQALEMHRNNWQQRVAAYETMSYEYSMGIDTGRRGQNSVDNINNALNQMIAFTHDTLRAAENLARMGVRVTDVPGYDAQMLQKMHSTMPNNIKTLRNERGEVINSAAIADATRIGAYRGNGM